MNNEYSYLNIGNLTFKDCVNLGKIINPYAGGG